MAVNNLRRVINLTKDLDANGDIQDSSLADSALALPTPKITSVHPTSDLSSGDLVFVVGTGFDQGANVLLISNTGVETVGGNVAFNSTSNVTFTWPLGAGSGDLNPYDIILEISNGTANTSHNSANGLIQQLFQGTVSGYTSGGRNPAQSPDTLTTIDKFAFSSDANATDVGDLTVARLGLAGQSSTASGYTSGGFNPSLSPNRFATIDKFPFASDGNATDVGDLTAARNAVAGQSSDASGYTSGGFGPALSNVIDKFPFSSDANATDVGDLTVATSTPAGQSSTDNGYSSGGLHPSLSPAYSNNIDKFPFASDANATDVGDLTVARYGAAGQSSDASGYSSGGSQIPGHTNVIDKFPFASDGNATDVGDLTVARFNTTGQSSTNNGYSSGGQIPTSSPTSSNVIDKFPFASDGNATDVGDLTVARANPAGQQV